ncbi:MAG: prepilin-type N-terminal cleavage/methylation domain-containing protein [Elusimicrobiaceae bacterium]|nr:prepilin-type N-terminal cleavage/methylation domain-containing protein [Elusimicrobiaceae bacterium]
MKKGFTLTELLMVVVIVGILSTIALPGYQRSIEKTRATEAMNILKTANDAVYAFAAERNKCPESFKKILVTIPGEKTSDTLITGKYFRYHLNAAVNAYIPGTGCGGIIAERIGGEYQIWNPYATTEAGKRTLACNSNTEAGIKICRSLGIYTQKDPIIPETDI